MFQTRSEKLERIDTGDYTTEEYKRFLREISFINRFLGDIRALKKSLFREIEKKNLKEFSVLDVGAGSGEFLREIAKFARKTNRKARLYGLELNEISADSILRESKDFAEINSIRGDALKLPFAENSFDYAICSLFTHHFTDEKIVEILTEMNRISRRGIFVIDLHRHPFAYFSYKVFCKTFRISKLVTEDGSLSVLRSFKADELARLAEKANLKNIGIKRIFPFRLVLKAEAQA
ncbi:MAG: methyltransferase domain-containing protein [Pyrinomonadaceae bacterium]|nr:methyltransferase domain-containing protein [Pyrinomonadaceae bacterium]